MALPNLWGLYNLRSSPFFQATLRADSPVTPLRLFVGRQRERQLLLTAIGSSAASRQAVAGRPGIGKTSLVQTVKTDAQAEGYWSSDAIIPISAKGAGAEGASEQLLGQLLSGVYDAVLANCPTAAGPEVEAAQQLVRSIRLRGGGLTLSAFGLGVGGSQSESVATPPGALLLDGPRVLRDLIRYAIGQGARGIVLHLNNLENLSEADASQAADRLRGIRDQALLHDGLHLIVVGTTDAVWTVVQSHTQIRSVFSHPLVLEPLALGDVEQLLANRYEALQLDPARPWRSPVEAAVVKRLYELFRGDLRGMLKALEDGITALLGLTSAGVDVAPVGLDDLLLTLRQRNQVELQEQLGDTAWERLPAWAGVDAGSIQTQAELVELWQVRQLTVSQSLQQLIKFGAVEVLPRRGREAIQYLMTGTAGLAL
ncbi:ATP-binding protein [Vulcanococcus limneticus Candia 3F8]|uniref:AAA family ATPase n=1 Tax=Vulcanococcus limneticus TaxID=2170428 RepID=UPI0012FFD0CA|nr:AAA family ATPase [Vulcanococcus limneticus]MCP9793322.1 ATP-binding protein [Vulcanococcus limneticus MW73D5]MCP9895331.1 ATP-binding protein [Vulcanococcus limneticus Candia 3F8]MCP9898723.1 ATP-binding protein [Vulcanococcus limneticus Candia 3B3]